jgi:hypothetical protein
MSMAPAPTAFNGRSVIAAALAAVSALGFATSYAGAPRDWLRHAISRTVEGEDRQAPAPMVARYAIDEGGAFTLDRSAGEALLKFEDSPEVWVLSPSHGPRGDVIYRNDVGELVLRATKLGGMTIFTSRRPGGSAAALAGPGSPLRLTPLGPAGLYQRLFQASVRCTRAAQHLVGFDALDANPASDGLIADAALVTMGAMIGLAARSDGKGLLARIGKVAFIEGVRPAAEMRGGVLTITVAPALGMAGRPSSERIISAFGGPRAALARF